MIGVILAMAAALPISPDGYAAQGLSLQFERIGHHGRVYFNADGSYLIVQTDPQRRTVAFTGRWTAPANGGVCIAPDGGGEGKCLPRLPRRVGRAEVIRSSLGEDYRLSVRHDD